MARPKLFTRTATAAVVLDALDDIGEAVAKLQGLA